MKLSTFCLALSGLALVAGTSFAANATPQKPNIIFILADDYGTGEVGCYAASFATPSLHIS